MFIERKEREELNALCKEVFGVSSRWQKWMRGVPELMTKLTIETVPGENGEPDTTKEVTVPVTYNGIKQTRVKYYTLEEVREKLIDFKKQKDDLLAKFEQQRKEQEEKKKQEELAKMVQGDASGSAI